MEFHKKIVFESPNLVYFRNQSKIISMKGGTLTIELTSTSRIKFASKKSAGRIPYTSQPNKKPVTAEARTAKIGFSVISGLRTADVYYRKQH